MEEARQPEEAPAGEEERPPPQGPFGGWLNSLRDIAATLIGIAQTRLELFSSEIQDEIQRAAVLLVWAFVALFAAGIGLFLAALVVIFAFWDTHRLLAASLVTCAFFVIALVAYGVLLSHIRGKRRLLDSTLSELARDRDRLRARL